MGKRTKSQSSSDPFFCSTMSLLRYPCFCSLNNHGASLVQARCYKEAIAVLSTGLRIVRDEMATRRSSLSPHPSSMCSCNEHRTDSISGSTGDTSLFVPPQQYSSSQRFTDINYHNNDVQHFLQSSANDMMGHDESRTTNEQCFSCNDVEQEAFLFSLPAFLHTPGNFSLTTISFMMIFNMALSYDLMSKSGRGDPMQENGMKTALKLYELAFRVLDGDIHSEIPLLYLCGLLNNMARLYTHFENGYGANWCLSYLLGILMHYRFASQKNGRMVRDAGKMESYYLAEFFRSAFVIVLKDPGTAEAA